MMNNKMIRTVILDDVEQARKSIRYMVQEYCPNVELVAEAWDVASGLEVIDHYEPDLLLLDIKLPDGTGFDLLNQLHGNPVKVIFITAFEEYAIQAFKFSALDYVVKPVKTQDLAIAVQRATQLSLAEHLHLKMNVYLENQAKSALDKKIVLRSVERMVVVATRDIIRCESRGNYTILHLNDGQSLLEAKTLKEFESLFRQLNFVRVHHSHLINLHYLQSYEKMNGKVILSDDSEVPVSHRKKDTVIKALNHMESQLTLQDVFRT